MPRKRDYTAPIDDKVIGTRIRALRLRRGLSQVSLAKSLGMDQSLLSRYERGELRVHGSLLASLAKQFRTSSDEVLGLKPSRPLPAADPRVMKRLEQIGSLPRRKKQALLMTLDEFLKGAGA